MMSDRRARHGSNEVVHFDVDLLALSIVPNDFVGVICITRKVIKVVWIIVTAPNKENSSSSHLHAT